MTGLRSFILTYHSMDHSGSVISLAPESFREQMRALRGSRIRVVPLDKVRASPGSVALTIDDGYRNFREHALPVLLEMRFPATVFVATGRVGREANWEDQIPWAAARPVMSRRELREISDCGVKLGAHSVNHCDLTKLSDEEVIAEMEMSRDALAAESGEAPACFAYPFGACDARVRGLAESRFELAGGTDFRLVDGDADPFDLPRLDIYSFRDRERFQSLLDGHASRYVAFRRGIRHIRSWMYR